MEELIKEFLNAISTKEKSAVRESKLICFCEKNVTTFSFQNINQLLRQKFILCLINELSSEEGKAFDGYTARCLQALRILSRDKSNLDEMVTENSCQTFLQLAGLYSGNCPMKLEGVIARSEEVIEALKCVCNLVYQSMQFKDYVVKYNCTSSLCKRLAWFDQADLPRDVKFFDLRLLFVVTALEANQRMEALRCNAVELLTKALSQVIPGHHDRQEFLAKEQESIETDSDSSLSSRPCLPEISLSKEDIEIFGEMLKVLFNITININQENPENNLKILSAQLSFILCHLLIKCKQLDDEPKNLQNHIINMLINLPYDSYRFLYWRIDKLVAEELMNDFNSKENTKKYPVIFECYNVEAICVLLQILDQRLIENKNLKEYVTPLLSVMTTVSKHNRIIRKYLRQQVLPSLGHVGKEKPEDIENIRGRLARLLTSAIPEIKESVGEFLFVLCKENVARLTKYVGYGNAAGFLADHGLMAGNDDDNIGNYSNDDEDSDTEEYMKIKDKIDPMTGAQTDVEVDNPLNKMSEEEKEAEAEELAKLLSKLNKNGLVKSAAIGPDGKPVELNIEED